MVKIVDIINRDITLDQDAFDSAAKKLEQLSKDMNDLKKEIQGLLDNLKTGFNTPAGEKFFKVYGENLIEPMAQQVIVIDHISKNLKEAKQLYDSVFEEYRMLNNKINNIN